jgi:hypothetical protein
MMQRNIVDSQRQIAQDLQLFPKPRLILPRI